MATELAVYRNVVDPLAFMRESGTIIAKSGMFGCETIEQGQALALISMTEGLPMLELRRRYHIVKGDLTMRADFMRAELRRLGGDYDWISDGDDGVEAKLWIEFKGRRHEVKYSLANAKQEGLVKPGSRWIKDAGSMLRARCSTKAVRMHASEVLAGFYSEEELADLAEEPASKPASKSKAAKTEPQADPQAGVVDAEYTVAATEPADAAPLKPATPPPAGQSTTAQRDRIVQLWDLLGTSPAGRTKQLANRSASVIRNLTSDQAAELTEKLEAAYAKRLADEQPCTPELSAHLAAKLKEAEQINPGTIEQYRAKLAGIGLDRSKQLTCGEASSLIGALAGGSLEAFFGLSLWSAAGRATATTEAATDSTTEASEKN